MNYEEILERVKIDNPKMSFKERQKEASRLFQEFKKAKVEAKIDKLPDFEPTGKAPDTFKKGGIPDSILAAAESRIRSGRIDINSIVSFGKEVMPKGELVRHDRCGINTYVTFEDNDGNKLPVDGQFLIFLLK